LVLGAAISGLSFSGVFAEPSEGQLEIIKTNCLTAQSDIQRISRNDVTARVNRGRDYDQVLKLFYAMNTRVAVNNKTVPKLAEITKSFEDALNDFRLKYNDYNDTVKATLGFGEGCVDRPGDFYSSLDKARGQRQSIYELTRHLDQLLGDYTAAVEESLR
jgi:hypothetical protein